MSLGNIATNYVSKNYANNDLSNTLPRIQYAYYKLTGSSSTVNIQIDIQGYPTSNPSSNYIVLTSFWYNFGGTSGTYGPADTVTSLGQPLISNKTPTSFNFYMNKSSGDNVNVYLCFTIIYYNS